MNAVIAKEERLKQSVRLARYTYRMLPHASALVLTLIPRDDSSVFLFWGMDYFWGRMLRNTNISAVIAKEERLKQSVRVTRDTDRLLRHASALMPTLIPRNDSSVFCFGEWITFGENKNRRMEVMTTQER